MISARNAPEGGLIIEVALPATMGTKGEAAEQVVEKSERRV
jgi:hypothetical protein